MSFGKRQEIGKVPIRKVRSQTHTPRSASTVRWIVLGALTGMLVALTLIGLAVGGILLIDRSRTLQLADRLAYQPADGPGYVNRKHSAKSSVDNECLGLWDNTLPGARDTMLCYSTRNPERLCEPTEKKLFVGLIDEYVLFERLMAATMAATPKQVLDILDSNPAIPKPIPRERISEAWRQLAKVGLIEKADFGWFPDDFIANVFAAVESDGTTCADS